MITAVDTSVLISIAKGEADADAWVGVLAGAHEKGDVVICDVVAAEFFAVVRDEKQFHESLSALAISFSPTSLEAARLAGAIFKDYRRERGPREHLIPDFLIAAHAQIQADGLAAVDRGYLRRYFPRLRLLKV